MFSTNLSDVFSPRSLIVRWHVLAALFHLACGGPVADAGKARIATKAEHVTLRDDRTAPKIDDSWQLYWIEDPFPGSQRTPATPADVMVTDLDGDGYADILVTRGAPNDMGTMSVLYGPFEDVGGGEYKKRAAQTWHSRTRRCYYRVRVGDLNNDGCSDIAVGRLVKPRDGGDEAAAARRGGVDVFYGKRGSDENSCLRDFDRYEAVVEKRTEGYEFGVIDLVLADFNADGRLDIGASRGYAGRGNYQYGLPVTPRIYLQSGVDGQNPVWNTLDYWEPTIGISSAFSIAVDDFTNSSGLDLLIGARGWCPPPKCIPEKSDAKPIPAWAVLFENVDVTRKTRGAVPFKNYIPREKEKGRAAASASFTSFPNVFDMAEIDGFQPNLGISVAVAFSSHQCRGCTDISKIGVFDVSDMGQSTYETSFGEGGHWGASSVGFSDANGYTLLSCRSENELNPEGPGKIYRFSFNIDSEGGGNVEEWEIETETIFPITLTVGDLGNEVSWREEVFAGSAECRHHFFVSSPLIQRPIVSRDGRRLESEAYTFAVGNDFITLKACLAPGETLTVSYPVLENEHFEDRNDLVFVQRKYEKKYTKVKHQKQIGYLVSKIKEE
jgi:hypothetical protein